MSFYRAALASARRGDLSSADRFVRCSLQLGEDAPHAQELHQLLQSRIGMDAGDIDKIAGFVAKKRLRKALKVKPLNSVKAHYVRGLIYAVSGRRRMARREFAVALTMDTGNELAREALVYLSGVPMR